MTPNIIHTSRRMDRLILLKQELADQNIDDYKLWEGEVCDAATLFGIARSHKKIVRWAKENNLPECLIFENDIIFTAPGAFQFYLNNKPTDFDLYLGGIYWGVIQKDNTIFEGDFCALHCYIVHSRFYDAFLAVEEFGNIDRSLKGLGKYVVCNPFVALQRTGYSDNKKEWASYDELLSGYLNTGIKLFGQ